MHIYKGMLTDYGKDNIPLQIAKLASEGGHAIERDLTELDGTYYDARIAMKNIQKLKELGWEKIIKQFLTMGKDAVDTNIDGIVLKLNETSRWKEKFGTANSTLDMVLAIPKWSRTIAVSTTDIEPPDALREIGLFDSISLSNYHFYEFFNRVHGVRGRQARVSVEGVDGKMKNLRHLKYLYRTCDDAKVLSRSVNFRIFTPMETVSGFKLGFYFVLICKISDVKPVRSSDGYGFDPYRRKVAVKDPTGTLWMYSSSSIDDEDYDADTSNHMNTLLGGRAYVPPRAEHIEDLLKHAGYVFVLAVWLLGDDYPYVVFLSRLDDDPEFVKYQLMGFMNTRKKCQIEKIERVWSPHIQKTLAASENLRRGGEWVYYKEEYWDSDLFGIMLQNNFNAMSPQQRISMGITVPKMLEWRKYTTKYFLVNDFVKRLYTGQDPTKEFQSVYGELWDGATSDGDEQTDALASLRPVFEIMGFRKFLSRKAIQTFDIFPKKIEIVLGEERIIIMADGTPTHFSSEKSKSAYEYLVSQYEKNMKKCKCGGTVRVFNDGNKRCDECMRKF